MSDNEYIFLVNVDDVSLKIYKRSYSDCGYEVVRSEDNIIVLKKGNDIVNLDREDEVLNFMISFIKRYNIKGFISIDLSNEINTIISESKGISFSSYLKKNNNITWYIRQRIAKSIGDKKRREIDIC